MTDEPDWFRHDLDPGVADDERARLWRASPTRARTPGSRASVRGRRRGCRGWPVRSLGPTRVNARDRQGGSPRQAPFAAASVIAT
jgi:hypothetical protein